MPQISRRAALALSAAAFAGPAFGQAYPSRPITLVIPFAAGGPTDTVGRLIAEAMGRDLGQNVVVENVGGAGAPECSARRAGAT